MVWVSKVWRKEMARKSVEDGSDELLKILVLR